MDYNDADFHRKGNNNIRVTVLLSTYNGERYLREQLKSLVNQDAVSIDLYVRDDLSSDNTVAILNEYKDVLNIKIVPSERNLGPAYSFMTLIHNTDLDTDYYAFCDQDDVWKPQKLISAIECIGKSYYEPILYCSATKQVDENLNELTTFKKVHYTEDLGSSIVATEAPGCTMVFTKRLMEELKSYYPQYLYMHDNWAILVCLSIGGRVIYNPSSEILYRRHDNNTTGINNRTPNGIELFIYRLKKLFTYDYNYVETSRELLQGYKKKMGKKERELITCMSSGNRLGILFNKSIKSEYFGYNIKFILQILIKGK